VHMAAIGRQERMQPYPLRTVGAQEIVVDQGAGLVDEVRCGRLHRTERKEGRNTPTIISRKRSINHSIECSSLLGSFVRSFIRLSIPWCRAARGAPPTPRRWPAAAAAAASRRSSSA
jgi:hypothetical protein